MITKYLEVSSLSLDHEFYLIEIMQRLGWCFEYNTENRIYTINLPIDDEPLYNYLTIMV